MRLFIICAFVVNFHVAFSQSFFFKYNSSIPVEINGITLLNPWVGGINAAQISRIDLNHDNIEDLFVFDKTTNKISTFITVLSQSNYSYQYAPQYEFLFPSFSGWVLLVDYNCDGLKDIFTSSSLGEVKVYKNATISNGVLAFELAKEAIETEGLSGFYSLHITATDLPSIVDMDDDGDLDVLTFDSGHGSYLEWHKNQSIEKYGHCDSLDFKRIGTCWGNFTEGGSCTTFELGVDCGTHEEERVLHSGSALLALDLDGDSDKDILTSDVGCQNLMMLKNGGGIDYANITSFTDTFPSSAYAVKVQSFPSAFYEDINFDSKRDLLVSLNLFGNEGNLSNFQRSIWLYSNSGTNDFPIFNYIQDNFLQDQMIDLGEYSYPATIDIDGDSDFDLIVGNRGTIQQDKSFYSTLYYYENVGSKESPSFVLRDTDYLELSENRWINIKPQFVDLNKDSKLDLILTKTDPNTLLASISYILNTSTTSSVEFNTVQIEDLSFNLSDFDSPYFFDADNDENLDLILGKTQGRLEYYENNGNNLNPNFTLKSNTFGGIENSLTNKNVYPYGVDLDGDSKEELLITDKAGNFKIFKGWQNNLEGVFESSSEFLFNENTKKFSVPRLGREVFPCAADFDNDGMLDLILGTNAGGLIYLSNQYLINSTEDDKDFTFKVYPNPAQETIQIESPRSGLLNLSNSVGQLILSKRIDRNIKTNINIHDLPKGLYILSFINNRVLTAKKLIKE